MSEKYFITGLRIWPPPRWPLVHEAKRALENGGREGYKAWKESLSPLERGELADQFSDLLAAARARVEREDRESE